MALAFAGGRAKFDGFRNNIFTSLKSATADQKIDYLGLEFRAAHEFNFNDSTYLRPGISLAYQSMNQKQFRETGADALGLKVDNTNQTYGIINFIEFGHEFKVNGDLQALVNLGYSGYFGGSTVDSRSWVPQSVSAFGIDGLTDQNYFNAMAGFDLIFKNGTSLTFTYDSLYSSSSQLQGGQVKFTIPF